MRRLQNNLGLVYGILVTLIVTIGIWWVYYMTQEGRNYERYMLQRLTTDRLHAAYLITTVPDVAHDPVSVLGERYPYLRFVWNGRDWDVQVDMKVHEAIHHEAKRRRRMFMTEGAFFMLLLFAGTTVLTLAFRRERDFKKARELFLAGATHEFKTPLASLRLYTETLNRPDLDEAKARRIRATMLEDVERLEGMVEQVLAVSREEELGRDRDAVLDLAHETQLVLEDMAPMLDGMGARVATDLPQGRFVRGDREGFSLALRNLVRNAAVYSPPPARITIALETRGKRHRLSVADEGPGIARKDRQRIFESFTRLDAPSGSLNKRPRGSGLGLYLVRRYVEGMGGAVELESEEGRGSTFTLDLPACEEDA
ncbi:HAMP domain-containing histidine kinase [bacterium]|nr:HAMP domain-containing histidine kinase [bacterium]HPF34924.1 HAMP domain-containing sensor histidine kinase [Candidatus Krumholzibacteria bacterium]HRX51002.1 HAMP domain-containing sensor histidine kinase [Candidatus Krumholzibacteria bacterium]